MSYLVYTWLPAEKTSFKFFLFIKPEAVPLDGVASLGAHHLRQGPLFRNVQLGPLHPFDLDGTIIDIEIIAEKLFFARGYFPMKSLSNFAPKPGGVIN